MAPGEPAAERDGFGEVILAGRLRGALRRLNPSIPEEAREEALRKVQRMAMPSLIQTNRTFHRLLRDGVDVEYARPDGSTKHDKAWLVDFSDVANNDWRAVNQFTVLEGQQNQRPDIVVFVNGLPLALIELKNAADKDATIWSAHAQLQIYKAEIPSLLAYNAVLIVSDGLQARMGSLKFGSEAAPSPQPSPKGRGGSEGNYRGGLKFAGLVEMARELRKKQTPAEALLWELLRNRQLEGAKFRRQHQFGPYICDFFCNDAKLVIECDGSGHFTAEGKNQDAVRDAYMASHGLTVLRFQNREILNSPESTLRKIAAHLPSPNLPSPLGRRAGDEGRTPTLQLETLLRGVFERRRFLDLLQHFIVFEENPDTGAIHKIIAGYQ